MDKTLQLNKRRMLCIIGGNHFVKLVAIAILVISMQGLTTESAKAAELKGSQPTAWGPTVSQYA